MEISLNLLYGVVNKNAAESPFPHSFSFCCRSPLNECGLQSFYLRGRNLHSRDTSVCIECLSE